MPPVASPPVSRQVASEESALSSLNLSAALPAYPSILTRQIQPNDLLADCLIDSWSKIRAGDLLTDNRGVLELVLAVKQLPGEEPPRYSVRLRRSEEGTNHATVTETHDDRDFTVRRGLTVIGREAAAPWQYFLPEIRLSTPEASALRKTTAEALVDSLVNRSLGFCDHAVSRLGGERHAQAFEELRGYQVLLKEFKRALDAFDLSSHQSLSVLASLLRFEKQRAIHDLPELITPFSLGEKYSAGLRRLGRGSGLANELGEATARVTEVWHALRAYRMQSWLFSGEEFGEQARTVIPAVSTSLFRGAVPEKIIDEVCNLVRMRHGSPDSADTVNRGIIFDSFTRDSFQGALAGGAHLLVAFDGFVADRVVGFMLYYPPSASLPPALQSLKQEHPNISTAIVDLVCVAADAPRETFNHLFWGHRFSLQATSDAQIHVGELMLNNLRCFTALVSRGAVAEPVAEVLGDDWQRMTVLVDVDRYKTDENPYAAELILSRKTQIPQILQRLAGDMTHGELLHKAVLLSQPLHIHIPDWAGVIDAQSQELFTDCVLGALAGFSGLITGPTRQRLSLSDAAATLAPDAASAFGRLVREGSLPHAVGLFPYPCDGAHYHSSGELSDKPEHFSYLAGSKDASVLERITPDPAISNRMKIAVESTGDVRAGGEQMVLELSRELDLCSEMQGRAVRHLIIVPEKAIPGLPEYYDWARISARLSSYRIAIIRDQSLPPVAKELGAGIEYISNPEQLQRLVTDLNSIDSGE